MADHLKQLIVRTSSLVTYLLMPLHAASAVGCKIFSAPYYCMLCNPVRLSSAVSYKDFFLLLVYVLGNCDRLSLVAALYM